MFLKYYWSSRTQSKVRENLYSGSYNETFSVSRERYAMRKYAVAKELDPPMEEEDIIQYLSRHFEEDIMNRIVIHEIKDIDRLLEYLRCIDNSRDKRNGRGIGNGRNLVAQEKFNRWEGGRIDQNNRSMNNNTHNRSGNNNYQSERRNYNNY